MIPNLLIGLREGLEAGLLVSVMLAAIRKSSSAKAATAPIWLGVLGAVSVCGSFAAVLASTATALDSHGREIVSGLLSVVAVALVTVMVFWMSRAAASLSSEIKESVGNALSLGAGALALTAFFAVGREGLETTLFFWAAAQAAGETAGPIVGAAVGLAAAFLLCWALYRRALRLNLGAFFSATTVVLIVIAAGVLSYGLGDLQNAGWLPGRTWYAFDFSGSSAAASWWEPIVTGLTQLSLRMTVLQVAAWLGYLAVIVPAFLRSSRAAPQESEKDAGRGPAETSAFARLLSHRPALVAIGLIVVPVLVAAAVIAQLVTASQSAAAQVTVTSSSCAGDFGSVRTGPQTFTVVNKSGKTGEINLVDASNGVVGEIETLGAATSAPLTATLPAGTYRFVCLMAGEAAMASAERQAEGAAASEAPSAIVRVTEEDIKGVIQHYQDYVSDKLVTLAAQVQTIREDLGRDDGEAAKRDWLPALLTWDLVGAAYGSFKEYGDQIAGLPHGLPDGARDPDFKGLRRLEYGLWHGQPPAELASVADALASAVDELRQHLADVMTEPVDQTKRPHEILEDAQRFQLLGYTDQGGGAEYAEVEAGVAATRAVLDQFAPLIDPRSPDLRQTVDAQLRALTEALDATRVGGRWQPLALASQEQRRAVDAALGLVLETLAIVPNLLEIPLNR